jgi:F5/8 type C domain
MSRITLNRKTLIGGSIALVVVIAVVLALVISAGSGSHGGSPTAAPAPTTAASTASAGAGAGATASAAGAGANLACGKPATASSTADGANAASNATDCDSTAAWVSGAASGSQWLSVNLGSTNAVDHIVVVWGSDYAHKFKIRTSTNGSGWHSVTKDTVGTAGSQTVALPSGTDTQWIQLYLESSSDHAAAAYSVVHLEVYALPGASSSAAPSSAATSGATALATSVPGSSTALWTGRFAGYGTAAWKAQWGYTDTGQFGQADLSEVSDPTAPGGGSALRVYYGAGSSANSCSDCPSVGGGQFYQQLSGLGAVGTTMANSETLDLKYSIKLPAGWDFGKAGKLPGLYGGVIGQESGGNHGADGWSTRYMFRDHDGTPNAGEVYLYTPTNSGPTGYGVDYFGNWAWTADGNWHTVEQLVNRQTGTVTVWFDGKQVMQQSNIATGISNIPFSGVFFSTFFGGHDTTWGPKVAEYAYFADFSLSTGIQH